MPPCVSGGKAKEEERIRTRMIETTRKTHHSQRLLAGFRRDKTIERTWRHVEGRSTSEIRALPLAGSESKVGDHQPLPSSRAQDVLRLEVSMEDPELVTELHPVEDLEEDLKRRVRKRKRRSARQKSARKRRRRSHLGYQLVVSDVSLGLGDHSKEVSVG